MAAVYGRLCAHHYTPTNNLQVLKFQTKKQNLVSGCGSPRDTVIISEIISSVLTASIAMHLLTTEHVP